MTVLVLVYDTCWDSVAVADDVVVVVVSFLVRWRVGAGFFRVGRMFPLKKGTCFLGVFAFFCYLFG